MKEGITVHFDLVNSHYDKEFISILVKIVDIVDAHDEKGKVILGRAAQEELFKLLLTTESVYAEQTGPTEYLIRNRNGRTRYE